MYKCDYLLKSKLQCTGNTFFCDSFVWVNVRQILVDFKSRESIWNLKYFSFFKNDCLKKAYSQSRGPGFKPTGWLQSQLKPFILPRSIKWVPGTPGGRVVKCKLSSRSGFVALRQLNPVHKKGPKVFFKKVKSWKKFIHT